MQEVFSPTSVFIDNRCVSVNYKSLSVFIGGKITHVFSALVHKGPKLRKALARSGPPLNPLRTNAFLYTALTRYIRRAFDAVMCITGVQIVRPS